MKNQPRSHPYKEVTSKMNYEIASDMSELLKKRDYNVENETLTKRLVTLKEKEFLANQINKK